MENLDAIWNKIGSVSKEDVLRAVLKDEIAVYKRQEQDPVACYEWQYSQIKGGYETEWHSGEDCIEPRGENTF